MAYGGDETEGMDYVGRQTYLAWTREVAARGGLSVRLRPKPGETIGPLGERYPESVITAKHLGAPLYWGTAIAGRDGNRYGYYNAPRNIRVLDILHQVENAVTIAEGKTAETAENIAKGLAGAGVVAVLGLAVIAFTMFRGRRT